MRRNRVTEGYACQGEEHRQAAQQVAAHLATAHACEAQGTQHKSGSGCGKGGHAADRASRKRVERGRNGCLGQIGRDGEGRADRRSARCDGGSEKVPLE